MANLSLPLDIARAGVGRLQTNSRSSIAKIVRSPFTHFLPVQATFPSQTISEPWSIICASASEIRPLLCYLGLVVCPFYCSSPRLLMLEGCLSRLRQYIIFQIFLKSSNLSYDTQNNSSHFIINSLYTYVPLLGMCLLSQWEAMWVTSLIPFSHFFLRIASQICANFTMLFSFISI